jgi:Zn-dependent peptidase ImmA (M78 family)
VANPHYRRGFKKEANELARELREEMGLAPHEPLCPWRLAEHLCVPVQPLSDFSADPEVAYLASVSGSQEFSAIVAYEGLSAFVIYSDQHSVPRQAANIAHELAHIVLRHPPKPPVNPDGTRDYRKELEDEASWLGPALLVSEEAALYVVEQRMSAATAADQYGVSQELLTMRINVTAARKRVARRRAA